MTFDPNKPYNELPILPPKAEVEKLKVLRKLASARGALGHLKGIARLIPDQKILLNTLTLEEARDSSEIENIITTRDRLYKAFASKLENIDSATKEVLRYREAMWEGFGIIRRKGLLSTNTIIQIQRNLTKNKAGIRKLPGTSLRSDKTGEIVYTPPEGENLIRNLMQNLEKYIHSTNGLDPLIKMAIIHYQFEAIHPFYDGNGRTGRIVSVLYLDLAELLDLPILYISRHIIKNKGKYYDLLQGVTSDQRWEDWILFMLETVEQTSQDMVEKVNQINRLIEKTIEKVRNRLPKIYSKELIELVFEQPYCKIQFLVDRNIAKRETASHYLKQLEKIGVLQRFKLGKEILFLNRKLYQLFGKSR